jgi:hypothetical protein
MTKYFSLLVLVALLASGCARAQAAKTTPDGPPLDVPAPPPREVEVPGTEAAPTPVPLQQEPARNSPPSSRVRPTAPPPKTEPPKTEAPKPEVTPEPPKPPASEEAKPPSTLQTKPASEEGEVERTIRLSLTRATNDLNRVDYRVLNADARTQYDSAKLFIRQAEDLLKQKNLPLAKIVADKASVVAAQLAGR